MTTWLWSLVVVLLLAWPVESATRTANPGSPGTLQAQLNAMQPCDTLILNAGTYDPGSGTNDMYSLPADAAGTSSCRTLIRPADGASVHIEHGIIIRAAYTTIQGTPYGTLKIGSPVGSICPYGWHWAPIDADGCCNPHSVIIRGIEVRCGDQCFSGNLTNWQIIGNYIHGSGYDDNGNVMCKVNPGDEQPCPCCPDTNNTCHGFYNEGSNVLIDGNRFEDLYGWAVHRTEGGTQHDWVFRNNTVNGAYAGAMLLYGRTEAYNNLVIGGQLSANTAFSAWYDSEFYNNTIVGAEFGIASDGAHIVRNNIILVNQSPFRVSNPAVETNNITSGNPTDIFANAPGGDYHLKAGSPAIGGGANLSNIFTSDLEGAPRAAGGNWDVGAFVFEGETCPPPCPEPEALVAHYTGETFADSSGHGYTMTANGGITATSNGFSCDGIDDYASFSGMPSEFQSSGVCISAWIQAPPADPPGTIVGIAGSISLRENGLGGVVFAAGGVEANTTSTSVTNNTLQHLVGTYDASEGARIYLNNAQQGALVASTSLLTYPSNIMTICRRATVSEAFLTGLVRQVRIYNNPCNAGEVANLFNEIVPEGGMSITHTAWFQANTAAETPIGTTDTDLPAHLITSPLAMRFALHKSDTGSVTEYFKLQCITNTGAGFPAWSSGQVVTNTFGTLGVRYFADPAITQGQSTSVLLPTDGFTGIAGKRLKGPIDLTSPYDAAQRVTIAQGQHAEVQYHVEFGFPLVATNQARCRLLRENDAELTAYSNLMAVTLQPGATPASPTSVQIGGVRQGGVH